KRLGSSSVFMGSFVPRRFRSRLAANRKLREGQAGVASKWQVGGLRYRRKLGVFLDPARRIDGILWPMCRVCRTPEQEHFRSINVQWIGQSAFLAVAAVPRINNLRAVNMLDSSTPAASTKYSR